MIISHKHQFIFIKTKKVAGTSVEAFLSQHCGPDDIITPIRPANSKHYAQNYWGTEYYNHIRATDVRRLVGEFIWHTYYTFTIERNPFDKTLSQYYWQINNRKKPISLTKHFNTFVPCLNYPQYVDEDGYIMVDRICFYETLMEDLGEVFERLKIPFNGSLGVRAKQTNRDQTPYQEVYSKQQAEMLTSVFRNELELHHYEY